MQQPSEAERFAACASELIEILLDILEEMASDGYYIFDMKVLHTAKAALMLHDKKELIEGFIKESHKFWDKIKEEDTNFFLQNAKVLFNSLPFQDIDPFVKLFTVKDCENNFLLREEAKKGIWNFFHSMVKICIKYIHKARAPFISVKGIKSYDAKFAEDIDLQRNINLWELDVEFPLKD